MAGEVCHFCVSVKEVDFSGVLSDWVEYSR